MFQSRRVVLLLVLIISVVAPTMARAQGVLELRACNRGSVPVQLVVAHAQGTLVYSWRVLGRTIEPGWCDEFFGQSGEALVAFGAKDSRGRFVSLKATSLADLGDRPTTLFEMAQNGGRLRTAILSRDTRTICVAATSTYYSTKDTHEPTPAECSQLTLPDVGRLLPITTSYYFTVDPDRIGVYHFNVRANPDRGEVTMTEADYNDVDRASAATGSAVMPPTRTTGGPMLVGRLVTGAEVRKVGSVWEWSDGRPLSVGGYVDINTGLPPLAPRQQPTAARTASEASVRKLANVLSAFTSCRDNEDYPVAGLQRVTLDDRGVATVSHLYMGKPRSFAMAIPKMDIFKSEPKQEGSCVTLRIRCKNGDYCGEQGVAPNGSATSSWVVYTNTWDQMTPVIDAILEMEVNYKDATPDIREVR